MALRLGRVIYWLCTAIAAVFVAGLWTVLLFIRGDQEVGYALAASAVAAWLFGRASRYVLSGE